MTAEWRPLLGRLGDQVVNSISIAFNVLVGVRLPFRVGVCSEFALGSGLASRLILRIRVRCVLLLRAVEILMVVNVLLG